MLLRSNWITNFIKFIVLLISIPLACIGAITTLIFNFLKDPVGSVIEILTNGPNALIEKLNKAIKPVVTDMMILLGFSPVDASVGYLDDWPPILTLINCTLKQITDTKGLIMGLPGNIATDLTSIVMFKAQSS